MSKIWLLLKINLLNIFGLAELKNFQHKKKSLQFLLITVLAFGVLFFYVYQYSSLLMDGYLMLEIPHVLLVQMFVLASTFILFTTIYKANGLLFNFKDYDMVMSLPITTKSIVISRIILTYIYNIFYNLLIMLPSFLVYVTRTNPDIGFYFLYFITLVILPLVPMILGAIIGSIVTYVSSYFKRKNIINVVFSIVFMALIMYISSNSDQTAIDAANIGVSIVNIFDKIYPLSKVYSSIISEGNLLALLIYISLPLLLFYLFTIVLSSNYKRINGLITSNSTNKNYKLKKLKTSSVLVSLYKKEFKRYFSSSTYVLNTGVGYILLIISCFALVTFGQDKLALFLAIPNMNFQNVIPLLMAMFVSISSTTSSSISLEGKKLWIIKSLPVNVKDIFKSKVLVNLSLSVPTIIIVGGVFSLYFKFSLVGVLLTFIIPLLYAYLSAYLGLLINLYFPKFDYANEVQVVKQSMASFIAVMIGMLFAIVPLAIDIKDFNHNLYLSLIGLIILILNIIVKRLVDTKGVKLFNKF